MRQFMLQEVTSQLAELLDEVASGEEVIITRPNGEAFRIISMESVIPTPKYGSAKGQVKMSDDFDEPLADFQAYMPRIYYWIHIHFCGLLMVMLL